MMMNEVVAESMTNIICGVYVDWPPGDRDQLWPIRSYWICDYLHLGLSEFCAKILKILHTYLANSVHHFLRILHKLYALSHFKAISVTAVRQCLPH